MYKIGQKFIIISPTRGISRPMMSIRLAANSSSSSSDAMTSLAPRSTEDKGTSAIKKWKMPENVKPWEQPGWWVEYHSPRTYPETEEGRRAAAKKYGLREGDYKPLPFDACLGDYPDLGMMTYDMRDPYENWTDYKFRRNFNEPVDYDFFRCIPPFYQYTGVEDKTMYRGMWDLVKQATLILAILFGSFLWGPPDFLPMMPKQYPYDYDRAFPFEDPRNYPLTHYTFEPASK